MASDGRNRSWPAAIAEVSRPITRPRRTTNQRDATMAAMTLVVKPMPSLDAETPWSRTSRLRVISVVRETPVPIRMSATTMLRRSPKRSMIAAENGDISP